RRQDRHRRGDQSGRAGRGRRPTAAHQRGPRFGACTADLIGSLSVMTLPTLCIQRPVMTTLLTLAIVLVGVVGYMFLPVAALPKVGFPAINCTTTLAGAGPSTMAAAIGAPLGREFGAISGVDTITSVSGLGTGRITIQFNLNRNIDAAAQDVQAAIANASRKMPAE